MMTIMPSFLATAIRRLKTIAAALLVVSSIVMAAPAGEKPKVDAAAVDRALEELATGSPVQKQLHALGVPGLEAVLNRLLPESITAPLPKGVTDQDIERLIGQLGNDDWKVYEPAIAKLVYMGDGIRRHLILATRRDPDADVRKRAENILQATAPLPGRPKRKYRNGFVLYAMKVRDKPRLEVMVRRAVAALQLGLPEQTEREATYILRACVGAVGRSGNDKFSEMFLPFLKDKDVRVAVFVTDSIQGFPTNHEYFPPLLLTALKSDREEVVDAAIARAPDCWDKRRKPEVKRLLQQIFKGENERLKFHTCFPLMHSFQDKEAIGYLLSQTQSPDKRRARRAITWLGDSCNTDRPAYPALLEKLSVHLNSPDTQLRQVAADALGTYAGEAVVRTLIPMLADGEARIASETARNLLRQRDKGMLRRLLTEAAEKHKNEVVRDTARELIEKLNESKKDT